MSCKVTIPLSPDKEIGGDSNASMNQYLVSR